MSQSIHILAKGVPGFGPIDGRCLPCSGVSWRALSVSPSFSHVKIASLRCNRRNFSFICCGGSGNQRRNPDFSWQNKHGFSRNRNRQHEEKDGFENFEESELFSSKNGPLLSVSGTTKFQATSTPGPREREIVELFRKVQNQLRERAAIKGEKKIEDQQGKIRESETVDSLLKLLRRHSIQQGKKKGSDSVDGGRDVSSEQPDETGMPSDFGSSNTIKLEPQDGEVPPISRPRSNFQRRSPVPAARIQPHNNKDSMDSVAYTNLGEDKSASSPEPKPHNVPEFDDKPVPTFSDGGVFDDMVEDEDFDDDEVEDDNNHNNEQMDLSGMKLPELRALAKSRGIKGFSKLKKGGLVDLLSGE